MGEENRQQKSRLSKIRFLKDKGTDRVSIKKLLALIFSFLTITVISVMLFSDKIELNENVIAKLLDFINSLLSE